ncbi:MAG TPA: histidine phosphatase family protein [Planctomycetota bacterium]|nr:histidine phosphatase family protein [Planctomycetota bacterium]
MSTDLPSPGRDLLLLRHAKASRSPGVASDFERPLTRRGRRDAPRIARWMKTHDLVPDCVIASPSLRTRETAELVIDELELPDEVMRWDERAYDADVTTLLHVIAEAPADARRILLVGHNPGIEDLVRGLGGDTAREPRKGKFFPPCALAHLRVGSPWTALRAGAEPVVTIVSWSRKKKRWKARHAAEPHA